MIITIITKKLNTRTASTRQPVLSDALVHEVACLHHNASNPAKLMHLSCMQDLLQAYQLTLGGSDSRKHSVYLYRHILSLRRSHRDPCCMNVYR